MESSQQPLTRKDILEIDFVKKVFAKQATFAKSFGQPLEQFAKLFREIKHLGAGAMGDVVLVERRADQQQFAAKK